MKIAILGDTHFGMRNDSRVFHELYARFYQELFFPTIKSMGIKQVIQTGDLFDRRKFINFDTLQKCRGYFFDEFVDGKLNLITYLGNHDVYLKNTLRVNSPELTLGEYGLGIDIIKEPTRMVFDGVLVDFIPWICTDNKEEIMKFIADSKSSVCFGHFEIDGFAMESGITWHGETKRELFARYDLVVSGHFHHKSSDGQIYYVGSPGEMTWADWEDPRGFHIFDTETRELKFIENPYKMFHKIVYDDDKETVDTIDGKEYAEYKDRYVKVIVKNKNSTMLFDRFISNFYDAEPADLSIVEDFTDYNTISDLMDETVDQAQSTHNLLDTYVDSIETKLDKNKMKSVMRKIYHEAQSKENA
jgi:DNA repair exonuclease SbcCD nuclease subunit